MDNIDKIDKMDVIKTEKQVRFNYSQEEMIDLAVVWMKQTYGPPEGKPDEHLDDYHKRLGLLVDFILTIMPYR